MNEIKSAICCRSMFFSRPTGIRDTPFECSCSISSRSRRTVLFSCCRSVTDDVGLGRQDARIDLALLGDRRVAEIIVVDLAIGIENVDEDLRGRHRPRVADIGGDADSQIGDAMAGRAVLRKDFPTPLCVGRRESSDFWYSAMTWRRSAGVGGGQQRLGPLPHLCDPDGEAVVRCGTDRVR